jgi:hypothetical protein
MQNSQNEHHCLTAIQSANDSGSILSILLKLQKTATSAAFEEEEEEEENRPCSLRAIKQYEFIIVHINVT